MDSAAIIKQLTDISRRELLARGLTVAGWGTFASVLGAGALETVSFFFPRVVFHPASTFRIGTPAAFIGGAESADAYGVMLIDERWKASQRFFVVRERDRIYATSARCAHLGCTVNWFADQRIFKCPCHGSEYHSNGTNFAGPAPRPLDRFRIELNLDGQLVVDTSIVYAPDRFNIDGAFVAV
ncbi:MAG TPA: Rieske 2Fe-2S domain-containing protein [Candidatus Binatia bacterium]|nr:Rieske 2Fe-2S domain-containing protein [Candidatus Binatia bacterium]